MLLTGTTQCQLFSTAPVERAVSGAALAPLAAVFGNSKAVKPVQLIGAARSGDGLYSAACRPFAPASRSPNRRALSKRRRHFHCCPVKSASSVSNMAASTKPTVRVDIWSDLSCPWCWVGKKRFDKALEQFSGVADFTVVYHSYVIDHATAPGGEGYLDYNVRRWGSDGWCTGLRRSGRPDGAPFSDWKWWPNSVKAHQLLLLAQEQGKGREAKEVLLRATYEEGRNISQVEALVEVAQGLALQQSPEELRSYLERDAGRAAVLADDSTGKRELNISGVPYFIVGPGSSDGGEDAGSGRRYALSGAQPASAFAQAFSKVLAEQSQ